jgi:hypothetical protein
VTEHYAHLFTAVERAAWRHASTVYKGTGDRAGPAAEAEMRAEGGPRARGLSDDPEVLALTAGGMAGFRARAAARILREHAAEVFLNTCPRCGGLCRTPRARLCVHSGHALHNAPSAP